MLFCSRSAAAIVTTLVVVCFSGCAREDWNGLNEAAKQAVVDGRPEDAERLFRAAAERARGFESDDPRRVISLNNLGRFLQDTGRLEEAIQSFRAAVDLLESRPRGAPLELAKSLANLATHYQAIDDLDEAHRLLSRAIEIREAELGPHHLGIGELLNSRGLVDYLRMRYESAREDLQRALAIYEGNVQAMDPQLSLVRTNLAQAFAGLGRDEEAEAEFRKAVEILAFGGHSIPLASSESNHAGALQRLGRTADAEAAYRRSLEIYSEIVGADGVALTVPLNNLGVLYREDGRLDEAEGAYRQALGILKRTVGDEHLDYAATMFNLGRIEAERGRREHAEAAFRTCLEIYRRQLGAEHPNVALVERAIERLPQSPTGG